MGQLQPKHASLVMSFWEYAEDKRTEARIRYQIEHLPSVCIYNDKNEPVCWVITNIDGSGGIGKISFKDDKVNASTF
jgi:hypothetical protein